MILEWKNKEKVAARVKCWNYDSSSGNKGFKMEFDLAMKESLSWD